MFESIFLVPPLDASYWVALGLASLLAGFIDATVGGGGLVIVPALFSMLPTHAAATILGTNKISGLGGTSMSAYQYIQRIPIRWSLVLPATIAAGIAGAVGAACVSYVPTQLFKKGLPFILAALLIYVVFNAKLGQIKTSVQRKHWAWGVGFGTLCGLYDGFFGPGTGSFLVLLWVIVYGQDFMQGSVHAKIVNVGCNIGALSWFLPTTLVFIGLGLFMMVGNMTGAWIGARVAMKRGNGFMRKLLIIVVSLLCCRTFYDAFLK